MSGIFGTVFGTTIYENGALCFSVTTAFMPGALRFFPFFAFPVISNIGFRFSSPPPIESAVKSALFDCFT